MDRTIKSTIADTTLSILVGVPASGKSTYAKEVLEDNPLKVQWISSDNIRIENDYNISNEKVFQKMWERTKAAAMGKKYIIYDATNLSSKRRQSLITNFKNFCNKKGLTCVIVGRVFLQPYDILIERNNRRIGRERVPKEVIDRMLRQFQFPYFFEGFDGIGIDEGSKGEFLEMGKISLMDQENPHHSYTLGGHLLETYNNAICGNCTRPVEIASLYHDVGKYWTKTYDDKGVAHYYSHENVSAYMTALHFLKHDCLKNQSYYEALILINYHMRPFAWRKSNRAKNDDKKRFGMLLFRRIKQLNEYDMAAH